MNAPHLLKRAERNPEGYIKGVAPSTLTPKVVRHLSATEMSLMADIRQQEMQVKLKMLRLLRQLGLDPRKNYRFERNGEVVEVNKYRPGY